MQQFTLDLSEFTLLLVYESFYILRQHSDKNYKIFGAC